MKGVEWDEHSTGHDKNCISLMNLVDFTSQYLHCNEHRRECNNANRTFPWQNHLYGKQFFRLTERVSIPSFDFQCDWQIVQLMKRVAIEFTFREVAVNLEWVENSFANGKWMMFWYRWWNWISENRFMKRCSFERKMKGEMVWCFWFLPVYLNIIAIWRQLQKFLT